MPIIQVNLEAFGRLRQENNEFKTNLLSGTLKKKKTNKITHKETKTKSNIAMLSVRCLYFLHNPGTKGESFIFCQKKNSIISEKRFFYLDIFLS